LTVRLGLWAEEDSTGVYFDSSAGFTLPNGAMRSPDGSWIKNERWEALSPDDQEVFAPICPDFVVELRSRSDDLNTLQDKMSEYIDCGARLGWLIDPYSSEVYIYRPGANVEMLTAPEELSGVAELPGFKLDMKPFWK
jgi:Uma2 family endonuclease